MADPKQRLLRQEIDDVTLDDVPGFVIVVPDRAPFLFPPEEWDDYKKKYRNFEILDTVFAEFLSTNLFSSNLRKICTCQKKTYLTYHHHSIPYLATISPSAYDDKDCISIRLCNNGFVYVKHRGERTSRQRSDDFIRMDERMTDLKIRMDERMTDLKTLKAEVKSAGYTEFEIWHSYKVNKIDVKAFAENPGRILCVTFEPGYPECSGPPPSEL